MQSMLATKVTSILERMINHSIVPLLVDSIDVELEKMTVELADSVFASRSAILEKDMNRIRTLSTRLEQRFKEQLFAQIHQLQVTEKEKKSITNLSLLNDEQLGSRLAIERMAETLAHVQRKGLRYLEQRLCDVYAKPSLGIHMPFAPQSIAGALATTLEMVEITDERRTKLVEDFEERLDPRLSDVLKQLNEQLAKEGVLPNLIIQDEEERIRRTKLKEPPKSVANQPGGHAGTAGNGGGGSGGNGNGAGGGGTSGHAGGEVDPNALGAAPGFAQQGGGGDNESIEHAIAERSSRVISSRDSALLDRLKDQLGKLRQLNAAAVPIESRGPVRELKTNEALSVLQSQMNDMRAFMETMRTSPDIGVADAIRRQVTSAAQTDQDILGNVELELSEQDQSTLEVTGGMFDVMLEERSYSDAVKPLMMETILPFVNSTLADPNVFLQPDHPARRLVNTISELCEDNEGVTKHDRDLIQMATQAIERIKKAEGKPSEDLFEEVDTDLNKQLEAHRQRTQLAEKRAAEAQRGQERLQHAREKAIELVQQTMNIRSAPAELKKFLETEWKHALSLSMLRKGEDSTEFSNAQRLGKRWMDALDMLELGEAVREPQFSELRDATVDVLKGSGETEDRASKIFEALMQSASQWNPDDEPAPAVVSAPEAVPTGTSEPETSVTIPGITLEPAAVQAAAQATASSAPKALPSVAASKESVEPEPTQAELEEVKQIGVGTWVQIPKESGGVQQLKVSWISGISDSVMLVNRRGQRLAFLSPKELVILKRRGELLVFESEAAVDQSMARFLDRLSKQNFAPRAKTAASG
jgi:hypothetical protein